MNETKKVNLPLFKAAQIIGVSDKTMLNYILRLRHGEKFGFDFDAHLDNGIGYLRMLIKQNRDIKLAEKLQKEEDDKNDLNKRRRLD